MTTELNIKVELMAGAMIGDVCEQMQELADRLNVHVSANFNGVDLRAFVGGSAAKMLKEYRVSRQGAGFKMAFS